MADVTLRDRPRLSIGLAVYNGSEFLSRALDTLLAQTYDNFELVISDNASTDATPDIIRGYASRDPRIRYIRQPKNQGVFANFQFVLDQATADYFMWASADDEWAPTYIERCFALLLASDDTAIACSRYRTVSRKHSFANREDFPSLAALASNDARTRVSSFVLMDEGTQKANAIYGIWRTEVARRPDTSLLTYAGCSDADLQMLTAVLVDSKIRQVPEILFTKTYKRFPPGSPPDVFLTLASTRSRALLRAIHRMFPRPLRESIEAARRRYEAPYERNFETLSKTLRAHFDEPFCAELLGHQRARIRKKYRLWYF